MSPPIHSGEFFHYTSAANAERILTSKSLRLTSIRERIGEGEISPFLLQFARYLDSFAGGIFYVSLTDINISAGQEAYFWERFAGENGARFRFSLTVASGRLRRVVYGRNISKWAQLFCDVTALSKQQLGRIFFWDDAATLCALYLPEDYDIESETRLVTRKSWGVPISTESGIDYIDMPLATIHIWL